MCDGAAYSLHGDSMLQWLVECSDCSACWTSELLAAAVVVERSRKVFPELTRGGRWSSSVDVDFDICLIKESITIWRTVNNLGRRPSGSFTRKVHLLIWPGNHCVWSGPCTGVLFTQAMRLYCTALELVLIFALQEGELLASSVSACVVDSWLELNELWITGVCQRVCASGHGILGEKHRTEEMREMRGTVREEPSASHRLERVYWSPSRSLRGSVSFSFIFIDLLTWMYN